MVLCRPWSSTGFVDRSFATDQRGNSIAISTGDFVDSIDLQVMRPRILLARGYYMGSAGSAAGGLVFPGVQSLTLEFSTPLHMPKGTVTYAGFSQKGDSLSI